MGEELPARRKHDDGRSRTERLDGLEERPGLHHHPGTATVGIIIHRAVLVVSEVAQVDDVVLDASRRARTRRYAQAERPGKELRKDRYDVDAERHQSKMPTSFLTK